MTLNENFFLSRLQNLNCIEKNPHVAVGVSGGPDSMALTFLLSKWIKLKKGKLYGLIFDHGIRTNSKEESYQVKDMLKKINIKTIIIKVKKNKLLKKNMSQARDNRFEGLLNFCNKNKILHLFLGHHFDDNLETYLIRKINGSNLEGLGSMNKITYFYNIQIIRPLIEISKSSILNFNKRNNIKFLEDPSNKDINFTRVKVRNFLENKKYKNIVKSEFFNLRKQIPSYKKMVWELLLSSLCEVQSNRIKINFKKLIKFDDLIIEKHISIILKFLSSKKNQTKNSKITLFIDLIKQPRFKIFNLSGIIIQKKSDFLIFSQK